MARERITRRQKNVSRVMREKRQLFREKLLANKKSRALAQGKGKQK